MFCNHLNGKYQIKYVALVALVYAAVALTGGMKEAKAATSVAGGTKKSYSPRECSLLIIDGNLSKDGSIEIDPIFRVVGYYDPEESGDYSAEVYNESQLLTKTYFNIPPFYEYPNLSELIATVPDSNSLNKFIMMQNRSGFGVIVPDNDSLTKIVIKHKQKVAKEIVKSKNPPKVSITSLSVENNILNMDWNCSDADGDNIEHIISLMGDNKRYIPIRRLFSLSMTEPNMNITDMDLSNYAGGDDCHIKIEVSDGVNTKEAYSESFLLDNHPPSVYITSPETGSIYNSTDRIDIFGGAYDKEDLIFEESNLRWYLDGKAVANGGYATLPPQNEGTHTVKFEVTDTHGAVATQERSFVVDDTIAPDVYIKNMGFRTEDGFRTEEIFIDTAQDQRVAVYLELFSTKEYSEVDVILYKNDEEYCSYTVLLRANQSFRTGPLEAWKSVFTVTEAGATNIRAEIVCGDNNQENNVIEKSFTVKENARKKTSEKQGIPVE